jgi:hypothetical protein
VPFLSHVRPGHDETLVARLAADDLAPHELAGIRAQVAECPACAELLADLRSISSATARLPGPQRTRDFRLTEADAARLRPAGWRGLLARLGSPGFAFVQPLAGGLAALGIAGLVLASLPSAFSLSSGASSPNTFNEAGGGAAPSAAALAPVGGAAASGEDRNSLTANPQVPGASEGVGASTVDGVGTKGASASPEVAAPAAATDRGAPVQPYGQRTMAAAAQTFSPLLVLSIVLLGAAVVLAGLRLIARRLT